MPTGLRYADCMARLPSVAQQWNVDVEALWAGLQVIERAVIEVAAEQFRKARSHEQ